MGVHLKISIITVCFNGAKTLQDAISSVARQQYENKEHLIVDGGSSDETISILKKNKTVSQWISEPDQGIYDAMNKGLALATGEVIGFLNADDIYSSDDVLQQVAAVFEDSTIDGCYADLVYVDAINTQKIIRYWKSRSFKPGMFKRGWMPPHPTFFVRKSVYEKYGRFDLDYKLAADFELTMRFMETHAINTCYVPRTWIRMRMGGATNKSIWNVIKGNVESYRACHKNGLKVSPLFPLIKVISRIPQFFSRQVH